ncbi:MAG: phage holin family protein [Christensenellales bacterium]|jgi:uncharacterized membrane protein YvlD (DUF360 family)
MMRVLMQFIIGTFALPLADRLIDSFWCASDKIAIAAGALLMLAYLIFRPLIRLLLGIFNIFTLGILYIFIDIGLLYFVTHMFQGYIRYRDIFALLLVSLIVNTVRMLVGLIFKKR